MQKYALRRQILAAIKTMHPAVISLPDLLTHPHLAKSADDQTLRDTIAGLELHNFIRNHAPTQIPQYRLTADGLDQLNHEGLLNEYIWGSLAL
jgi:hypothetical protein